MKQTMLYYYMYMYIKNKHIYKTNRKLSVTNCNYLKKFIKNITIT